MSLYCLSIIDPTGSIVGRLKKREQKKSLLPSDRNTLGLLVKRALTEKAGWGRSVLGQEREGKRHCSFQQGSQGRPLDKTRGSRKGNTNAGALR